MKIKIAQIIFVIPLSEIAAKFIPEDFNAIEIHEIATEVVASFQDMEYATDRHFTALKVYVTTLRNVNEKIDSFLSLK